MVAGVGELTQIYLQNWGKQNLVEFIEIVQTIIKVTKKNQKIVSTCYHQINILLYNTKESEVLKVIIQNKKFKQILFSYDKSIM